MNSTYSRLVGFELPAVVSLKVAEPRRSSESGRKQRHTQR